MKLLTIIRKNFHIVTNSKLSLLLLLLGPILLMVIIGLGLSDNGLRDIPATVYAEEETEFTKLFIEGLKLSSFQVRWTTDLQSCINDVRRGSSNICIELAKGEVKIPKGLGINDKDIEKAGIGYSAKVHADFSKPRIVWGIIAKVEGVINRFSDEIRAASGEKFKEKTDEFSNELNYEPKRMQEVINSLVVLEAEVDMLERSLPEKGNIDNIGDSITGLRTGLDNARASLPTEFLYLINPATSKIDQLEKYWYKTDLYSVPLTKSRLDSVSKEIDDTRRKLRDIKDSIDELREDSKDIGSLKWDHILHPIPMSYRALSGEKIESTGARLNFFDYIFPSFIGFFILLVSIFLSTTVVIKEKSSGAHIRNSLSKASKLILVSGTYLTVLLIVAVQLAIVFAVANMFLNFTIFSNIQFLILTSILTITVFTLIGIIFASFFNSSETAMVASISLSLVLIMFSSLVTPIETLPPFLKAVISNTPLVIAESLFRKLFIFESGITSSITELIILGGTALFLFISAWVVAVLLRRLEAKS